MERENLLEPVLENRLSTHFERHQGDYYRQTLQTSEKLEASEAVRVGMARLFCLASSSACLVETVPVWRRCGLCSLRAVCSSE